MWKALRQEAKRIDISSANSVLEFAKRVLPVLCAMRKYEESKTYGKDFPEGCCPKLELANACAQLLCEEIISENSRRVRLAEQQEHSEIVMRYLSQGIRQGAFSSPGKGWIRNNAKRMAVEFTEPAGRITKWLREFYWKQIIALPGRTFLTGDLKLPSEKNSENAKALSTEKKERQDSLKAISAKGLIEKVEGRKGKWKKLSV